MAEATYRLSAALADLRAELLAAQTEGDGKTLKFDISEIELELKVVLTDAVDAGVKVGWKILGANAGASSENQSAHTLKLKMQLTDTTGHRAGPISGKGNRPPVG